jgi:hypothetical protein
MVLKIGGIGIVDGGPCRAANPNLVEAGSRLAADQVLLRRTVYVKTAYLPPAHWFRQNEPLGLDQVSDRFIDRGYL